MSGITGTLHEDLHTFLIISRSVLLRMRKVSEKSCRVNQNTHFMFSIPPPENLTVYEIMWKNMVESCRPQTTVRRMRIECRITEATNTHSQYVILIAFPLQQWLHEHVRCYVTRALRLWLIHIHVYVAAVRSVTRQFTLAVH